MIIIIKIVGLFDNATFCLLNLQLNVAMKALFNLRRLENLFRTMVSNAGCTPPQKDNLRIFINQYFAYFWKSAI